MNLFSIAIVLCTFVYGVSPGGFTALFWAASKTEKLQANIQHFSTCVVNAGAFPPFDSNTYEGRRLSKMRFDMYRLSRCTIWNVAICGPTFYIRAMYQLMMLILMRPSLISELAASPFKCAFSMICQMWPTYPKIHCVDGVLVDPTVHQQMIVQPYGQGMPYGYNAAPLPILPNPPASLVPAFGQQPPSIKVVHQPASSYSNPFNQQRYGAGEYYYNDYDMNRYEQQSPPNNGQGGTGAGAWFNCPTAECDFGYSDENNEAQRLYSPLVKDGSLFSIDSSEKYHGPNH